MFDGLGHMARRDAIRENDGPAIISNWKVDMISFHNHHHPKYFILGHRLVADRIDSAASAITPDVLKMHSILAGGIGLFAKGDFYSEVGDLHGISKASVSRCITRISKAIVSEMNHIKFPSTEDEINVVKREFYRIAKVSNVIGAVDGTLIPIIAPKENEVAYVCRKGYYSLNIQGSCEPRDEIYKPSSKVSRQCIRFIHILKLKWDTFLKRTMWMDDYWEILDMV
ncbi:HARBI1 [Mytilus edulis]|uniref:HARBI1 n=1 Tax=Mytilus edulis TaxID=6550 RepID=A0A8S3UGQ6_MYTED|nr:HARBI1 [Mytilus edulis]